LELVFKVVEAGLEEENGRSLWNFNACGAEKASHLTSVESCPYPGLY